MFSEPVGLSDLLSSGLWQALPLCEIYDMQSAIFQPVGGMGMVGQAFARELDPLIRYNAKVVDIDQDERGVSVTYEDTSAASKTRQTARADWCVCTIPLSILGQIPMKVGTPMADAIAAVPLCGLGQSGLAIQAALLGGGRADLRRHHLHRPSDQQHLLSEHGLFQQGQGRPAGRLHLGLDAAEFTAMSPQERVAKAVEYGSRIHPQYPEEFDNGVAVAWHRSPFTHGLLRHVDRRGARSALRQSVRFRRAHRPRRRARLVPARLAGRRPHVRGSMPSIDCIGAR